jgi:hypothetical protein
MKEQNLERAKKICNALNSYRSEIDIIKNLISIDTAEFRVTGAYIDNSGSKRSRQENINLISIGNDVLFFIVNQKRLYLQGRILELEAELRNL